MCVCYWYKSDCENVAGTTVEDVAALGVCVCVIDVLLCLCSGGSFRHFLWQVVRELQSPVLPLLVPCPSSSVGINQGKYILAPGPISYAEEKLLQFFGQVSQ